MLLNTADAVRVGSVDADAVFAGNVLVWSQLPQGIYDPDTQRFLDATGLPINYAPALDGLVRSLKAAGLWAKMNAVYPFIGGTADLHKWNLIDPRDTDDAFRLTFTGQNATHSDQDGYKPNPAPDYGQGWGDTHLVPLGTLDPNSVHLSLYSLTPLSSAPRCDMGIYHVDAGGDRFHLITHYTSAEFYYTLGHRNAQNVPGGDGQGLYASSRTAADSETAYRNGLALGANSLPPYALPPISVLIGALNGYTSRENSDLCFGFASIGSGLDAQNNADLNAAVQAFRLAISNAHWTPASIPGLAAWFDPEQDIYADGERITSYIEHSPARREFVAEINWEGPIFRAGGKPYLDFGSDGSDGGLSLIGADFNAGLDGYTAVFVADGSPGNYAMMLVHHTDTDGIEMRFGVYLETENVLRYSTAGIVFVNPEQHVLGRWNVHIQRVAFGVRTDSIVNGVNVLGGAPAALNIPTSQYIGRRPGGFPYIGNVAEALVFAGPVSDSDLALLTDYLTAKHGL